MVVILLTGVTLDVVIDVMVGTLGVMVDMFLVRVVVILAEIVDSLLVWIL